MEGKTCKRCGGSGFVRDSEGIRQSCVCFIEKRTRHYLRGIGDPAVELRKDLYVLYRGMRLGDTTIFNAAGIPIRDINAHIAAMLLQDLEEYRVISAYGLFDIMFQNNTAEKSVLHLTCSLLVILYGYEEFENKRMGDIICQVLANRDRLGKRTWVVYRKPLPDLVIGYCVEAKYGTFAMNAPVRATEARRVTAVRERGKVF